MSSEDKPRPTRRVVPATCSVHGGTKGFTNVVLVRSTNGLTVDPHATGCCLIEFTPEEARDLHAAIGELL